MRALKSISLSPRESLLLLVLAGVVAGAMWWQLLWRPSAEARAILVQEITMLDEAMRRLPSPTKVKTVAVRSSASSGETTAQILTRHAADRGLTLRRLEPDGSVLRVVLADAPFESLLDWLADLERKDGVVAISATLERRPAPGSVLAQIAFRRGGGDRR